MMLRFAACLAVTALLIAGCGASAQDRHPGVQALLDPPNAPSVIDRMQGTQRVRAVETLAEALYRNPRDLDVAKLLCAIRPWRLDSTAEQQNLLRFVWEQMATEPSYSPRFRWLDCVAINVAETGYRATSLTPFHDLRQAACSGIAISDDGASHLSFVADRIREFDRNVTTGLSAAMEATGVTSPRFSYYPLRNAFRIALLDAAQAVNAAQSGDADAARAAFGAAADGLRERVGAEFPYAETRNGWTQHSDKAFYVAFYDWLAGRGDLEMSDLVGWPAAINDPAIKDAIPPATKQAIEESTNPDYVDPIFVERLLPGARSDGVAEECDGWRRRSYHPHKLARHVANCAAAFDTAPATGRELEQFDSCLGEYEAEDWRVQFASVSPERVDIGMSAARETADAVLRTESFTALPEVQRARIERHLMDLETEVFNDQFTRIVTPYGLHTSDRVELERILDELERDVGLNPRPLLARSKIF